ncbi:unnamed protein product [Dovyalis caffra]|uniref:Uncharacterized protein n=1 Tax=Dovyalis caffra TaxID=77055 RepID=A0AAV1SKZ0_9ROSI|nr:unnamed protein product [Dovyalis caffra]
MRSLSFVDKARSARHVCNEYGARSLGKASQYATRSPTTWSISELDATKSIIELVDELDVTESTVESIDKLGATKSADSPIPS